MKERTANLSRLKAFMKVGKSVPFPLDTVLPPITRTEEVIKTAEAKLTLPIEQLHHAQFWFVNANSIDEMAFSRLASNEKEKALQLWQKKENFSSLQNSMVLYFVMGEHNEALHCAEKLYAQHVDELMRCIAPEHLTVSPSDLWHYFLDTIDRELGMQKVLTLITSPEWKQYLGAKAVGGLISELQQCVDQSNKSKGKGANARLEAGKQLMRGAKSKLAEIRRILSADDVQYQLIADKVGLSLLQCGIDYYNDSEDADAAYKAMELQKYALDVVVGKMAKDRCRENAETLKRIIAELPPQAILAESRAIMKLIERFHQSADTVAEAESLLNLAKPHLQAMKEKVGATDKHYLQLSTLVVGLALHNVIEEVNSVQKRSYMAGVEGVVKRAVQVMEVMRTFDMEADFRQKRFMPNWGTLKGIFSQIVSPLERLVREQTHTPPRTSITQSSDNDDSGCMLIVGVIVFMWIVGIIAFIILVKFS